MRLAISALMALSSASSTRPESGRSGSGGAGCPGLGLGRGLAESGSGPCIRAAAQGALDLDGAAHELHGGFTIERPSPVPVLGLGVPGLVELLREGLEHGLLELLAHADAGVRTGCRRRRGRSPAGPLNVREGDGAAGRACT
jgi:hypothetical protein